MRYTEKRDQKEKHMKDIDTPTQKETDVIMLFLLQNGFTRSPLEIVHNIATLICKNLFVSNIVMRNEYKELAATREKPDNLRARLRHHIQLNFDAVHESVRNKYAFDIGEFLGVKNFIDQMTLVYAAYESKS